MKKTIQLSRIVAMLLVALVVVSSCQVPASAANYTTNYTNYTTPSSTSDYAYWNGFKVVRASRTTTSEVKWMQASLNWCIKTGRINASYLDVDGSFGPATRSATIKFQMAFGLNADGSFGPKTIQMMKSVLKSGTSQSTATYKLVWPVKGLTASNITGMYGYDGGAGHYRSDGTRVHSGLDISNNRPGLDVLATADGTVIETGYTDARGYYIVIYHEKLNISSLYEHLQNGSLKVSKHQTVKAGQVIAKLGNSGMYKSDNGVWVGYAAHLHFGLMEGKATSVNYDLWYVNKTTNTFSPDPRYNGNISYTYK